MGDVDRHRGCCCNHSLGRNLLAARGRTPSRRNDNAAAGNVHCAGNAASHRAGPGNPGPGNSGTGNTAGYGTGTCNPAGNASGAAVK